MRAIHIVTMRLSSSFIRPILLDFVSCSPPRQFSLPRRLICAATKANGGGRSGSIVAPLVVNEEFQKIDVNPPKGTRDFPPEDMRLRNWLFNHFKEVSRLFGYEEVDFPVLETEALFIRKAGEEIRDQLYCFENRGNRRVALRPELTPSLARLVIQKGYGCENVDSHILFGPENPFPFH